MHRSRLFGVVVLVALGAAAVACGDDDAPAGTTSSEAMPDTESDEMSGMDDTDDTDDMDMGALNMGDASVTPADEVVGAELVTGDFVLLDTAPSGYEDLAGTALLARHDAGTTVTIELEGLVADTDFIAHVHDGVCADNGGDHYKFDPEGSDLPPNEIHLAFVSDADGGGFMTAENDQTVDDRARSIVVHPVDLMDNKVACAELS